MQDTKPCPPGAPGITSLVGMPTPCSCPSSDRILHGGAAGMGVLMASSGIGALVAALFWPAARHRAGQAHRGKHSRVRRLPGAVLALADLLAVVPPS